MSHSSSSQAMATTHKQRSVSDNNTSQQQKHYQPQRPQRVSYPNYWQGQGHSQRGTQPLPYVGTPGSQATGNPARPSTENVGSSNIPVELPYPGNQHVATAKSPGQQPLRASDEPRSPQDASPGISQLLTSITNHISPLHTLLDRFNRITVNLHEAGDDCEQRESPVPEAPAPAMNPVGTAAPPNPPVGVSDPGNVPQDATGMHKMPTPSCTLHCSMGHMLCSGNSYLFV